MNYWIATYRVAWGTLAVLFAIGLTCIFLPKFNNLRALQKKRIELQKENHALERLIMELRVKQEQFATDPAYIERVAREQGRLKPHETAFKFTNETSRTPEP